MDTTNFRGFNQLVSIVRQGLSNMLAMYDKASDWVVVRSNQPTIQALQNDTVYFDIVSRRRYGVQGTRSVKDGNGNWRQESIWYEELLIQVSAFRQRNPETDTEETLTSGDVIEFLQACVNSNPDMGLEVNGVGSPRSFFEASGVQVIRSTEVRELDYETDSGLKEKLPQFDFLLVVEQRFLKNIGKIDTIEITTKRI